jgi:hypothetical protein
MSHIIRSPTAAYEVGNLIGHTADYSVYLAADVDTQEEYLLKIASDATRNGLLDREAFLLGKIQTEIARRDAEYQRERGDETKRLGYHRCFPRIAESFTVPEQGARRVNLVAIYGNEPLTSLVPLEQWRTRERVRLDPKTSAWIMGRLLKILTLTHPLGVEIGRLNGGNILVNPEEHHVLLFDWSAARHHPGPLPKQLAREELKAAATQVVFALGGDPRTGALPASEQLPDSRYADFLKRLIDGERSEPISTGAEFYDLVDDLWERGFHPFTTHQL